LRENLDEGITLPAPNKRGIEIERDVSGYKKVKIIVIGGKSYKNVKTHVYFSIFRQERA